jgi:hypothetical protein
MRHNVLHHKLGAVYSSERVVYSCDWIFRCPWSDVTSEVVNRVRDISSSTTYVLNRLDDVSKTGRLNNISNCSLKKLTSI